MPTSREQKLVDIVFEVAILQKHSSVVQNMNEEQLANWIASQLMACGFDTYPCGSSWGVLK